MRQPPVEVIQAAKASEKKTGVPAVVSMAQWILESGWGAHSPGNNPFGMKVRAGMNDPYTSLPTREVVNGKSVTMIQKFRKFDSLEDAFEAHALLISTAPVYKEAMAALPDVDRFISLMAKRYATAPDYATQIKGLIKSQALSTL